MRCIIQLLYTQSLIGCPTRRPHQALTIHTSAGLLLPLSSPLSTSPLLRPRWSYPPTVVLVVALVTGTVDAVDEEVDERTAAARPTQPRTPAHTTATQPHHHNNTQRDWG